MINRFGKGQVIYTKDEDGDISVCIFKEMVNNTQFSVYCGVNLAGMYIENDPVWGHVEDYKAASEKEYKYLFQYIVEKGYYFDCTSCAFKRLKFRVGDIVTRIDGDGRAHEIIRIEILQGLNRNEHAFPIFEFADGEKEVGENMLKLIKRYGYGNK